VFYHEPVSGDAPQGEADVRPVVDAMQQRIDPLLDIRWEPRAVMVKRGGYDPMGKVSAPVYDGRWEIVHYDISVKTAEWRAHTRICFVTERVEVAAGLWAMSADGPYAPVGMWLVDFLMQADKHNQEGARKLRARLDAMNDTADQKAIDADDAAIEEAAGRQYFAGTMRGRVSEFHPVGIALTGKP
jgi:hypothetical protein